METQPCDSVSRLFVKCHIYSDHSIPHFVALKTSVSLYYRELCAHPNRTMNPDREPEDQAIQPANSDILPTEDDASNHDTSVDDNDQSSERSEILPVKTAAERKELYKERLRSRLQTW